VKWLFLVLTVRRGVCIDRTLNPRLPSAPGGQPLRRRFLILVLLLCCTTPLWAYIDPGTGSMLFSALSGIVVAVYFFFKNLILKLKSLPRLLAGRKDRISAAAGRPFVIYSEGRQYWNVFLPIIEELDRRGLETIYYTSDPEDPGLQWKSPIVATALLGKGHAAFFTLNALEAQVCLMTTPGLEVYHWKRSPKAGRYVHILHAPNDATLYRLFGLDYYDAVLLNGDFQVSGIRELEAKRGLPAKNLITVGSTYLDVLKGKADAMIASLPPRDGLTVLVSPSWGPSGLLSKYGMDLLGPLAQAGMQIILRPHPQSWLSEALVLEGLQAGLAPYPNVEWDRDRENLRSMARADLMISDFSGIIFDFSFLFSRPVLYTESDFDRRPYDASDIDGPLWTFEVLKTLGHMLAPEDLAKIGEVVKSVVARGETRQSIEAAKAQAWAFPGEAGRRAVDALEAIQTQQRSGHETP